MLPPLHPLPAGYAARAVDRLPDPAFQDIVAAHLFGDGMVRWNELRDEAQRAQASAREAHFAQVAKQRLGIWHGEALVAASVGWQDGPDRFHMGASVVVPAHRRLGLYTHLATWMLHWARQEGFAEIWSNHVSTNSPVIIAKLKLGFILTGFDVTTTHGTRVSLTFPLEPIRREALLARSGLVRPTGELARFFAGDA
ncbi:MAG: hypothetical protein JWM80_4793 [Cyanobacteria bacterium RYN_339]|nr:hypothetical protein [Cyanobacteria bacterium RYN_339]